ncbi:hypothetical protein HK099_002366 [Clydaea vesicula]|uniref:Uncharacterized protein n=1 Tax=Clydaea vesicula TaxID=447962 RepID=A0AAD5U4A2_9FUNG|nr:hypothetical protein HK099_002366 [Clydaea vesicula]
MLKVYYFASCAHLVNLLGRGLLGFITYTGLNEYSKKKKPEELYFKTETARFAVGSLIASVGVGILVWSHIFATKQVKNLWILKNGMQCRVETINVLGKNSRVVNLDNLMVKKRINDIISESLELEESRGDSVKDNFFYFINFLRSSARYVDLGKFKLDVKDGKFTNLEVFDRIFYDEELKV